MGKKYFFLLLVFLTFAGKLLATDYYVDPVNGNDANNGLSSSSAKQSIQAASDLTLPGDNVYLMNGIYYATNNANQAILTISRSGSQGNYITYKPLAGHTPKLKLQTGLSYQVWRAIWVKASYIIIDGIEIEGTNQSLDYTGAYQTYQNYKNGIKDFNLISMYNCSSIAITSPNTSTIIHHIIIRNCNIHDCGGGIGYSNCDYTTTENNVIYNNCWYSMYAGSGFSILNPTSIDNVTGYKMFVRKNIVHDNKTLIPWEQISALSDGNGIILDVNIGNGTTVAPYVGRYLVENNVSYNNGGGGVHAYKAAHVDIINNTAYNNGTVVGYPEMDANQCTDVNIYNNIMYARTGANCNGNDANTNYDYNIYYNGTFFKKGPHDISGVDPQFVTLSTNPATANFSLKSTSPAINNGSSVAGQFSTTDILGLTRPVGFTTDMGAYEYGTVISRPEITLKQNGTEIISGTGSFDFGDVASTSPKTVTFTIQNIGDQVLNLTGTPKVVTTGTGFTVSTDAPATVAANGAVTFQLTLTPTAVGVYSGTVSIASNDADEGTYTFAITGYGYDGTKALQTIIFNPIPIKVTGASDFDAGAFSTANLPITYTSSNTAVATIVAGKIHVVSSGTSTITASQPGNATTNIAKSVDQLLTVTPVLPPAGTNMITNPSFDANTTGWSSANKNGGTFTITSVAQTGYTTNVGKVVVTSIGTSSGVDNVQVGTNIFLVNGKNYLISFKASADANRNVTIQLLRNASPFSTIYAKTTGITTIPTTYGTYAFTSNYTGSVAFRFFVGGSTIPIYIDDVSIVEEQQVVSTYYSKATGDLSSLATYGTATDGTGTAPTDFNGSGTGAAYQLSNRGASYTLTSDLAIGTSVYIQNGTTLDLAGKTLTVGSVTGPGKLTGSNTSSLIVNNTSNLSFVTGKEQLGNLTLSGTANVTLTSALNIAGTGSVVLGANTTLNTGGLLTLKSDASGSATIAALGSGASILGNVTAERYLFDKRAWRLIAPAVNSAQTINAAWQEGGSGTASDPNPGYGTFLIGGSTANGFDIAGTSGSLLVYNGSTFGNAPNTNVATVSSNTAYFLFSIGNRSTAPNGTIHSSTTLRTTGTVVTGNKAVTVNAAGYTLVGNPYPAAVDFSAVTRSATVPNQFYAWDINLGTYGGYVLVSNSGSGYTSVPNSPSGLNNIIPSGGAIMVQSDGSNAGTLTFNEGSKATQAGSGSFSNFSVSSVAKQHNIRVNLADNASNLIDGVMASFAASNSNNVDGKDASKLPNFDENISLSRAGKQLTLERRNDLVTKDTVFIQLSGMKATTYKLQIDPADFNEPGMVAYLDDAFLKTHTKLNTEQLTNLSFNTTADPASYKNRFQITFTPASELLSFVNLTGTNPGKQIDLKWTVTGEDYVQSYAVEKWNGTGYTPIASLQSTSAGSYSSVDHAVLAGDNTYRISAKDSFGNIMFSQSIVMKASHINANVVAYPNPATQKQVNLSFEGMPAGSYNITVMNAFGQVMQKNSMLYNGTTASKLLSTDYSTGVYTVNIQSAGYNQSIKVIIP